MRFKHWPKTSYVETSRKRAAAARSIQHTIDRAPLLFAAGIETPQTVEERIEQNRANWRSSEASMRAYRASCWREARAMLFALSDNERAALREFWNKAPYPADPNYLCEALRRWNAGELDLEMFEKARRLGEAARERMDAARKEPHHDHQA